MVTQPERITPKPRFSLKRTDASPSSECDVVLDNFSFPGLPLDEGDRRRKLIVYRLFLEPSNRQDLETEVDTIKIVDLTTAGQVYEDLLDLKTFQSTESDSVDIADIDLAEEIAASKRLQVIEFPGGFQQLKTFLKSPDFAFSGLLSKLSRSNGAATEPPENGLFIEAAFKNTNTNEPEQLAILVRVPYLAKGQEKGLDWAESWSTTNYRNRVRGFGLHNSDEECSNIVIHQAWFLILNNGAILAARSINDSNRQPMIFPCQDRLGGFHVLVLMIKDIMHTSETKFLKEITAAAKRMELQTLAHNPDDGEQRRLLLLVDTVAQLVEDQIRILNDLKDVFERAAPDRLSAEVESNQYSTNMVTIPVLSGEIRRTEKQIIYVVAVLRRIITELQKVLENFRTIRENICKHKNAKSAEGLQNAMNEQTAAIRDELIEQKSNAAATREEIAFQGKTMSAFTLVTVLFLPLGFFTQYFALDGYEGKVNTIGKFWAVTASFTAFIMAAVAIWIMQSQYELRTVWRSITELFTSGRRIWPLSRQQVYEQEQYRRSLQRCYVKAVRVRPSFSGTLESENDMQRVVQSVPTSPKTLPPPPRSAANSPVYDEDKPDVQQAMSSGSDDLYLRQPPIFGQEVYTPAPAVSSAPLPTTQPLEQEDFQLKLGLSESRGIFRYDREHGWLFIDHIDTYGFLYIANIDCQYVPPIDVKNPVRWKKVRMPMEKEPLRFKGRLTAKPDGELGWAICKDKKDRRWDTSNIKRVATFAVGQPIAELSLVNLQPGSTEERVKLYLVPAEEED